MIVDIATFIPIGQISFARITVSKNLTQQFVYLLESIVAPDNGQDVWKFSHYNKSKIEFWLKIEHGLFLANISLYKLF